MRKIICFILAAMFSLTPAMAESISRTIGKLGINKSAISVTIKDVKTGDTVYSLNPHAPKTPASTLKLITLGASLNTLGNDYIYKTTLYKSTNNDLYIKLSGDPLLKSKDLQKLISAAKAKNITPKTFYVDNSAFDGMEWGEGWQWDDDLNPLMPKFSVYNIDGNLLNIEVAPTKTTLPANIIVKPFYPLTFVNQTVTDYNEQNSVKIERNSDIAPNILSATGIISKLKTIVIPAPSPKRNFILRLEDAIRKNKFEYFAQIKTAKLPDKNIYKVDEIEHPISDMIALVLKNSNNLVAETIFKTAGAVWADAQGNIENSLNMLNAYFEKNNLNSQDIKIVDGSGVSKNNLMTSDFMTNFLIFKASDEDFEDFLQMLPTAGQGTLKNRMLYFKDNLHAKTGTLSDTSAMAGYLTSRRGKLYAFDIMMNDAKTSSADKKNIEEQILRTLYLSY